MFLTDGLVSPCSTFIALLCVLGNLCGFRASGAHTESALSPWFDWDLTPTSAEAVVPHRNPCRKGVSTVSNVNQDLIQVCLIYRTVFRVLIPVDQYAGERRGLVTFTGIHLCLSCLIFHFSPCRPQVWSLASPLVPLRGKHRVMLGCGGCREGVEDAASLRQSLCSLQRDLAGVLRVT